MTISVLHAVLESIVLLERFVRRERPGTAAFCELASSLSRYDRTVAEMNRTISRPCIGDAEVSQNRHVNWYQSLWSTTH